MNELHNIQKQAIDAEGIEHIECVQNLCMCIAAKLEVSDKDKLILHEAAILHDVGKIKLDQSILNAPRALTDEEFELVKTHSLEGYRLAKEYGVPDEVAIHILNHHERCDGSGYPRGLSQEQIPILSKILSVADVFDALLSHRPYKTPWRKQDVYEYFKYNKMFCETMSNVIIEHFDELYQIKTNYS